MQTDCLTADDKEGLRTYTFHLPSAHSANGDCLPLLVSVLIVSRPRYIDFVGSQTPRSSCGGSAFRHPPDLHNISSCSACALACADEPRCRGFEYQPVGSQCALFGTAGFGAASADYYVPYETKHCYTLRRLFSQQILASRGFSLYLSMSVAKFAEIAPAWRNLIVQILVRKGFDVSVGQVTSEVAEEALFNSSTPNEPPAKTANGIRLWTQIDFARKPTSKEDTHFLDAQVRHLSIYLSDVFDFFQLDQQALSPSAVLPASGSTPTSSVSADSTNSSNATTANASYAAPTATATTQSSEVAAAVAGPRRVQVYGSWPSGVLIGNISAEDVCPEHTSSCSKRLRVTYAPPRDHLQGGTFFSLHDPWSACVCVGPVACPSLR